MEDLKLLVKAPELADLLSISERQVYYLLAEGKIPSVKMGRNRLYNPLEVLEAWEKGFSGDDTSEDDTSEDDTSEDDTSEDDTSEDDTSEDDTSEDDTSEDDTP